MIRRIIFRKRKPLQLITSFAGALTGLLLLLVSVQFYADVRNMLASKSDLLGSDYLVVQKNISGMSSFAGKQAVFSEENLEELRRQPFIEDVGEFVPGRFSVYVFFPGLGGEQGMQTFAFVESVPDKFIDVKSAEWKWEEGDEEIPVILPSSYMDSYNFGFAPGLGLPPVSEAMFAKMKIFIEIEGNRKKQRFRGNIAGFSDRINTILVPMNFVRYANGIFESREEEMPSRLILAVKDIHDPALAAYLEENGFDTNKDSLRGSQIKSVLEVTLTVFFILGCIIILLALHSFVQYTQIIIAEVNYELKVMLLMGYTYLKLAATYLRFYLVLSVLITVAAGAGMLFIKKVADSYLETYNLKGSDHVMEITWYAGLIFMGLMILITSFSILTQIRRLAKNLQGGRRG